MVYSQSAWVASASCAEHGDARVVADHVHGAEAVDGSIRQGAHLRQLADVGDDGEDVGPGRRERVGGAREGGGIDVGEHQAGAAGRERLRQGRADAAAAARDDGDAIAEGVDHAAGIWSAARRSPARLDRPGRRCYLPDHGRGPDRAGRRPIVPFLRLPG